MGRHWHVTTVLAIVLGLTACRSPSSSPADGVRAHRDVVGCYAFFDRASRPAAESLYWAPATARLVEGGQAVRLIYKPTDHPRPSSARFSTWSVDSLVDTLHVRFSSGFSGTEFLLGLVGYGDTLRGRALEHWDSGPRTTIAGAASAVRIPCSSAGDTARQ